MNIRPAQEHEAEALSALALKAKAYWGYSADTIELWRQDLNDSSKTITTRPTFVAAVGDEIAGFYSLVPSTRSWKLDHLWVLPQFMDRGIGRALVAHALETALRGGASCVTVDADPNAESFYLACGAERCGEVPAPIPGQPKRVRPQLAFRFDMQIVLATIDDASAILELQKLAYHAEAILYDDWSIPPLTQTLAELRAEFTDWKILKASCGNRMIGSVRAIERKGICSIARLMVHPKDQRQGIGGRLMQTIESMFPEAAKFELFTGHKSEGNIRLYERLGYCSSRSERLSANVSLVFFEKPGIRARQRGR
jgi:ribosomal protein S18 acetylase RimI-like enzyme